jgi:hypothetical protein
VVASRKEQDIRDLNVEGDDDHSIRVNDQFPEMMSFIMLCDGSQVGLWRAIRLGILGKLGDILGNQESWIFPYPPPKRSC